MRNNNNRGAGLRRSGGAGDGRAADVIRRCVAETLEGRLLFATFTVTSVDDDGPGTLRQAILDANAAANLGGVRDTIEFQIAVPPGGGAGAFQTITPESALPTISDPVFLDATTQGGDNYEGPPLIELDGQATGGDGFHVTGGETEIRGFVINDWAWGIRLSQDGGNFVAGNYIGTDSSGTAVDGNDGGVLVEVGDNDIGGTAETDRNLISGNGTDGIRINAPGNLVVNNYIGTDVTGSFALGNGDDGIEIDTDDAQGNLIGGDSPEEGNIIAHNDGDGVEVQDGSGHSIVGNSIFDSGEQGIDLLPSGVNNNDAGDPDAGPNNLQNFPVLSQALPTGGGQTNVRGVLTSEPNSDYRIEFYTGVNDDGGSDNGEGQTFLGSQDVSTDADGFAEFEINVPAVPAGRHVTATATSAAGDTSEFGRNAISGTTPGINVEGDGNTIVNEDDTPSTADNTDFGSVGIGEGPVNGTFIITNTGTSALTLTGNPRVRIEGPNDSDFVVIDQPNAVLDPGDTNNLVIQFTPSGPGVRTAQVVIPNTDPDENPYRFTIQGTGTRRSASLGPNVTVVEGNAGTTQAVFTVTLSRASTTDVTLGYSTGDAQLNPATPGQDYQPVANGFVTIPAGQTTATISIPVIGDTAFETDERFRVDINALGEEVEVGNGSAAGIITNDDASPQFSIGDVSVTEGQGGSTTAVFTVTLGQVSQLPASVNFSTADGTATAGSDYQATAGTITLQPGQTSATVTVTIIGERVVETDETFTVNLSAPAQASIGDSQGLGTIVNDDATFTFPGGDGGGGGGGGGAGSVIVERAGGTFAPFTVALSIPSDETISVRYNTRDGSATAPFDYTPVSGQLTFAPGETSKTINVFVTADTLVEGDETFDLILFEPTNAALPQFNGRFAIRDSALPFLAVDARNPLTYTDANGDPVTVAIRGPGQANVQFANSSGVGDAVGLVVDGTTGSSQISVRAGGGGTTVGGVSVNRPARAFAAPETDIIGNFSTLGTFRTVQARSLTGGGTMRVDLRGNVAMTFGRVQDYNLRSDSRITKLAVGEWLDLDTTADRIEVPNIGTLVCNGDFGADILTGTITKATIGGALAGANLTPTVGVRQLTATSIRDSNVFVGVEGRVAPNTLPTNDDDFFNDAGFIRKLTTSSFVNSRIAANTIGQIALGAIQSENANRELGTSSDRIGRITGQTERGPIDFSNLEAPSTATEDDYYILIY